MCLTYWLLASLKCPPYSGYFSNVFSTYWLLCSNSRMRFIQWLLCSKCTRALIFFQKQNENVQGKSACAKRFASASQAKFSKVHLSQWLRCSSQKYTLYSGLDVLKRYPLWWLTCSKAVNVLKSTPFIVAYVQ